MDSNRNNRTNNSIDNITTITITTNDDSVKGNKQVIITMQR